MFWWDCCTAACLVVTDLFDRADSTDLDSGWDERSGDWEIKTNNLRENGNSGALAICTTAGNEEYMYASTVRNSPAVGDKHRLVVNYLDDSNYFFAELETTAFETTQVKLYRRAGGVNTLLTERSMTTVTDLADELCLSSTSLTYLNGPPPNWLYVCDPVIHTGGKKAGLGNGGTSVIDFQEFSHYNYLGSTGLCCSKQCECKNTAGNILACIPTVLTLTFVGGGSCSPIDGLTVTMTWDGDTGEWHSPSGMNPSCAIWDTVWTFGCNRTVCTVDSTEQFFLHSSDTKGGCGPPEDCLEATLWADPTDCSPLTVPFPRFTSYMPGLSCGCCDPDVSGWWEATITE